MNYLKQIKTVIVGSLLAVGVQASIIFDNASAVIIRADNAIPGYANSTQSLLSSFEETLIDGENLNITSLVASISNFEASFDIDMFHRRNSEVTSSSFTQGSLYFDIDALTAYSLSGFYSQDGANDFYQFVVLRNTTTNQVFFEGGAQDLFGNENYFTLGDINNSGYYSSVNGNLSGDLTAGSYELYFRYHTVNNPAGGTTLLDATAQGDLHFSLAQANIQDPGTVPEPMSLALLGFGTALFSFLGVRKKSIKPQA